MTTLSTPSLRDVQDFSRIHLERESLPDALTVEIQANGITPHVLPGERFSSVDFSSPSLTLHDVERAAREFYRRGTALFVATVITAPADVIERNVAIIAEAMKKPWGAGILGIHLEGPFLCKSCKGAHPEGYIAAPDVALFERWFEAADKKILWTTVSPAYSETPNFIKAVRRLGPVVSIGHHNATAPQIRAAFAAGATGVTHAGNAWPLEPILPKEAAASILAQLAAPKDVHVMVIPDGEHLSSDFIETVYRTRRNIAGGFAFVSDISPLGGAPLSKEGEPDYTIFHGLRVRVVPSATTRFNRTEPRAGAYLSPRECLEVADAWSVMPTADLVRAFTAAPLEFLLPALNKTGWSLPVEHIRNVRGGAYASTPSNQL